jgi:hypothetical protein
MKSFADWVQDMAEANRKPATDAYLWEGFPQATVSRLRDEGAWLDLYTRTWKAYCKSCQRDYEIDVDGFTSNMNYCGGSPRCLP